MKKIPSHVQSLIRASNQINNHSTAIEELVYNALDAGATSIAVRVNIEENTIQVIDNGSGISSKDFKQLGLKYMSSKFIDLNTLKSFPNKYGFRGQALSNLINVSKSVKFISRHEKTDETWLKLFEHGKEKKIEKCYPRPSKGTTVDITGFSYNLKIKNELKDTLHILQSMKTFLEHISLIHCNVSLSLRDDSRNEILFKIHKNRTVTQTLSTLYNINKKNLQELQVEKNEYKVTAHLSKYDSETGKNLIFLNGKLILNSSKLHKIVNSNLSKSFKYKQRGIKKPKTKNIIMEEESNLIQKSIPDYYIFIKCPYTDYELSNLPKQSVLEFKDWNQINKLLDKLVKFYNGDMKLKEVNKEEQIKTNKPQNSNTREQVKKIMERIFGTNTRKTEITGLHNGIRGKQVKRKITKKSSKSIQYKDNKPLGKFTNATNPGDKLNKQTTLNAINACNNNLSKTSGHNINQSIGTNKYPITNGIMTQSRANVGNMYNKHFKKVANMKRSDNIKEIKNTPINLNKNISKMKKSKYKKDLMLRKSPTDFIKKRRNELQKDAMLMLDELQKKSSYMTHNKNHEININAKNCINLSDCKQIDEVIVQNNNPHEPKAKLVKDNKKIVRSNYGLLQTILESQKNNRKDNNIIQKKKLSSEMENIKAYQTPVATKTTKLYIHNILQPVQAIKKSDNVLPMITYESHKYYAHKSFDTKSNNSYHSHVRVQENRKRTFITKQSRDNFAIQSQHSKMNLFKKKNIKSGIPTPIKDHIRNLFKQTSKLFNLRKQILGATCESSYTIELSENNRLKSINDRAVMSHLSQNTRISIADSRSQSVNVNKADKDNNLIATNSGTYVLQNINNNGYIIQNDHNINWAFHGTYTIERNYENSDNNKSQSQVTGINESNQKNKNFIFVSKSQEQDQYNDTIEPLNVCETILNSKECIDKEFESSFKNISNRPNIPKPMCQNILSIVENQEIQDILENIHLDDQNMITEVSNHFDFPNHKLKQNIFVFGEKNNIVNVDTLPIYNVTEFKITDLNDANKKDPILTSKQNLDGVLANNTCKNARESNGNFILTNRLCFVPKGLSPIFQNCKTTNTCEYNLSRDYYEKELYNNFAENVRNNAEVFEPKIQGANEVNTKAIEKVNIKLVKDKSALKFDGESLKTAKVLRQIDDKFISATMKERGNTGPQIDYLVLFDQHAVHERIRLESNLEDYFEENQWKTVPIDEITIKLSKDHILYLHNFKDKFEQLGLRWTVLNNNEVSISSIPQAIIGKSPRQVEKVIRAVKSLIIEEINIIKMQGGCVSLYPKSIMDLVFSEACRYAIKFGDKLSNAECMELLKTLSSCKTPFQCAHGRPVMAVVMEIKPIVEEYKINIKKISDWKKHKMSLNNLELPYLKNL